MILAALHLSSSQTHVGLSTAVVIRGQALAGPLDAAGCAPPPAGLAVA
jgi:hypothetical protein